MATGPSPKNTAEAVADLTKKGIDGIFDEDDSGITKNAHNKAAGGKPKVFKGKYLDSKAVTTMPEEGIETLKTLNES